MAVRGRCSWRWWGLAGAASQPLPSGDPDIRPRLLFDHFLYFVVDLLEAVPFHHSCGQTAKANNHFRYHTSKMTVRDAFVRKTPVRILPEKHSRKSCSSLRARSIPFLACSSVRRVLISLPGTKSLSDQTVSPRHPAWSAALLLTGRSPATWAAQIWRWDEAGPLVVFAQRWPTRLECSASPAARAQRKNDGWGLKGLKVSPSK